MKNDKQKKKESWRILIFVIAVLWILFMWMKKDIMTIYTTMSKEQIAPLIATTVAVTLLKVAAIAVGLFLIKWIVSKIQKKR